MSLETFAGHFTSINSRITVVTPVPWQANFLNNLKKHIVAAPGVTFCLPSMQSLDLRILLLRRR